jgi:hypothetical protein
MRFTVIAVPGSVKLPPSSLLFLSMRSVILFLLSHDYLQESSHFDWMKKASNCDFAFAAPFTNRLRAA